MRSEKGQGVVETTEPTAEVQSGTGLEVRIREFRRIERTFGGRILWLLTAGLLSGSTITLLTSPLACCESPFVWFFACTIYPDDVANGAFHLGFPFPFLRVACRIHSDGAWDFGWMVFLLDTLIWSLPALPFAAGILARKVDRMKRWRQGVCLRCEYDLRRLAEPVCPECGTPFEHVLVDSRPS